MSERDKLEEIFEMFQDGMDLIEENEDKIERIMGRAGKVKLGDDDPLKELMKTDEEVLIMVETKDDFSSIGVEEEDGGVKISLNEKIVKADIPDDCVVQDVDANLTNGVLEVTIPRGE